MEHGLTPSPKRRGEAQNMYYKGKTRSTRISPTVIIFWILLIILMLKVLGLLKAWLNIDPWGINVDVGLGIVFALVLIIWQQQIRFGERLARLETKIEPLLDFFRGMINRAIGKLFSASNPPAPAMRGKKLLEKWSQQTLNLDEAKELKVILEGELEEAKKEKRPFEKITDLTILLAILSGRIERLEQQKSSRKV